MSVPSRVHARLMTAGEFFFRQRSWTPIPFIIVLVVCRYKESIDALTWWPGLGVLCLGEGLRIWGVAVVGRESRTRSSGASRLVTHGPYQYVRNPLYVGNLFLTLGATLISELLWMVPVALALFFIQYVPIVLWEEHILATRFGAEYATYCQHVPRWIPTCASRRPTAAQPPHYQWRNALWSERSTFGTLAILLVLMVFKEDLVHLPKYWKKYSKSSSLSVAPITPRSNTPSDPSLSH